MRTFSYQISQFQFITLTEEQLRSVISQGMDDLGEGLLAREPAEPESVKLVEKRIRDTLKRADQDRFDKAMKILEAEREEAIKRRKRRE